MGEGFDIGDDDEVYIGMDMLSYSMHANGNNLRDIKGGVS